MKRYHRLRSIAYALLAETESRCEELLEQVPTPTGGGPIRRASILSQMAGKLLQLEADISSVREGLLREADELRHEAEAEPGSGF